MIALGRLLFFVICVHALIGFIVRNVKSILINCLSVLQITYGIYYDRNVISFSLLRRRRRRRNKGQYSFRLFSLSEID